MGHAHSHSPAAGNKKKLALVFGLTLIYLTAEVVGGSIGVIIAAVIMWRSSERP